MRPLFALITACAIAVAPIPSPANADDAHIATFSAPRHVAFGKTATLTGRVSLGTGNTRATSVGLERRIAGTTWHLVKRVKTADDGTFSITMRIRATTQFRVVANLGAVTSKAKTVALSTGTSAQRALYKATVAWCGRLKAPGDDPTAWWARQGPKGFKVAGTYAVGPANCMKGKEFDGGTTTWWRKVKGIWKLQWETQNALDCKHVDHTRWPAKLLGGEKCWDHTVEPAQFRAIVR